ncbi:MAG: ABC-F family ATP-binding cassette domain-containing protein, partial [Rhodocyclaceae bacterium]|nr:ABC-F family ATP-binding cassette domain-containing protein [Rhodocyclaceae bacterium]
MPASIVLSGLSWTTPNGEKLLSNLDLTLRAERTGLVGRNGAGKSTLLALITGALTPASGSVSADGTLGMLRQDLARKPGETIAGLFGVAGDLAILRRAERGEAGVEELASADWTLEARMEAALSRLGLSVGPETLLEALSGG